MMYRLTAYGQEQEFEDLSSAISTAMMALEIYRDIDGLISQFEKNDGVVTLRNPQGTVATIEEV